MQRALPADVFNIEVDCEHVYEVGDAGVLVHNACAWKNFENYRAKHYAGQIAKRNGGHGSGADLILENGDWVEQKAWNPKVWERLSGSARNESMLVTLKKQVDRYIRDNPNGRLILEFAWKMPDEVAEVVSSPQKAHGDKLEVIQALWKNIS